MNHLNTCQKITERINETYIKCCTDCSKCWITLKWNAIWRLTSARSTPMNRYRHPRYYIFNHSVTIVIIFCVVSQQSLFQAEPLFERDKWIVKWTVVNPARPIITKALTNELSRLIWRPRSHILTGVMLLFMPFLIAEKPHYFMS